MIISFEINQTIARPIEEVFAFLSDFSNMPLWNYYIQNVKRVSGEIDEFGTIYEQKRPHDTIRYKIVEFHKPDYVSIELQPPNPLQRYGFSLQPVNGQTRVVYHWQVDLRRYKLLRFISNGSFKNWLLSFARKHIFRNIKPATEQNFLKLKELLETGKVTLQNGKNIVWMK